MRNVLVAGIGGAVLLCGGLSWAEEKAGKAAGGAKVETPKMAPEGMARLKFWLGKWKCDDKQHETPMGPGMEAQSTIEFRMALGDSWMSYTWEMTKPKMPGGMGMGGWDPGAKKMLRWDYNPMGVLTYTSDGWQGDTVVFSGDALMGGKRMPAKSTITRKGDSEWTDTLEVAGPDGKMMVIQEAHCTRIGKSK